MLTEDELIPRRIIFLVGVTNAGKSTFIDHALKIAPGVFGAISVGKEFRRRYPPSYFEGSGAPEKTEAEAIEIFQELLLANSHTPIVLVDGQPRKVSQIEPVMELARKTGRTAYVIWLHANRTELERRLNFRFDVNKGENEREGYELSKVRLVNDTIDLFDVIASIRANWDVPIFTVETDKIDIGYIVKGIASYTHFLHDWRRCQAKKLNTPIIR